MARAKRGFKARRRRNRLKQEAKGYRGGRSKLFKAMVETVRHARRFTFRDRRRRKREFRSLWIIRINAAARDLGVRYSALIHAMSQKEIRLDRKVLADLAISDPGAFRKVVEHAGLLQAAAA